MFGVADSFRVFVSKFWVLVFGIVLYIFSFNAGKCCNSNDQINTNRCKKGENVEEFGRKEKGFEVDDAGERVNRTERDTENSVMALSTSKYELLSGKNISGFIEEPKSLIFSVQELYMGSNDCTNCDNKILTTECEEVIDQAKAEDSVDKVLNKQEDISFLDTDEVFDQEKTEDFLDKFLKKQGKESSFFSTGKVFDLEKTGDSVSVDKVLKKQEEEMFTENESRVFTEFKILSKHEIQFLLEDCWVDSEFDTISSSDGFSKSNYDFDFDAYEFLAERNFSELGTESLEARSEEEVESTARNLVQEIYGMKDVTFDSNDDRIELKLESHSSSALEKHEEDDLFREDEKPADSHRSSEASQLENSAVLAEEILSSEASHLGQTSGKFEESSWEDKEFISDYDDDDDDDEFALEHDDLLKQLKMELRNARTGGLPTILEECESPPKTLEEIKPLKIEHKFEHKDHMKEIHKFYSSYLDKMRKLDILNNQAMHAIGLFQLKEPEQSIKTQKSLVPAIKSLLAQNLWPSKPRRSEATNPAFKFIGDLRKDFELVYVGQLCLSWEILHWQYKKALELQEFDSQGLRQYNQVAGEFQIFQVLLQRFIENEPFQGCPRVQNYVNNRCARCNFLLVPAIKDDSLKDKKGRKGDGEDAITSPMLTAIIEESMRDYWEFLRTDKDENDIIFKGPELQDLVDSELLSDIRTDFLKKERRLKEILRSGSCVVKKLQKHHENGFNRTLFISQVEMKLISKVLTMSKLTTDQLVWCHEKLAKINFSNRKLLLEPSFLLFPF